MSDKNRKAASAGVGFGVGCCLLVYYFTLGVGPSIYWLYAGAITLDDKCNQDGNLSVWLTIFGSVGILFYTFLLFLTTCAVATAICGIKKDYCFLCTICSGVCIMGLVGLYSLFSLVALIVGLVLVIQNSLCHEENEFLYNSALAAVIVGFILFNTSLCTVSTSNVAVTPVSNNNEEEYDSI
jgi:hypothetical protein